jgi:hypothetical protein
LGRSARWVQKWVGRHDPADRDWAQGAKRGPERAPNRTADRVEASVLAVRARLAEHPWAQVGAPAIAWELEKLGAEVPPARTIERILERSGATERGRGRRRRPKGVPYPQIEAQAVGEVHEADLVGPRYLEGRRALLCAQQHRPRAAAGGDRDRHRQVVAERARRFCARLRLAPKRRHTPTAGLTANRPLPNANEKLAAVN